MSLTVLVTGASGFVGSHLAAALVEAGHRVRAMTRHPDTYPAPASRSAVTSSDPASLAGALAGVDAAYYLVHSLDDDDFERKDAEAARTFGAAAAGRTGADHLPRRARPRGSGPVRPPALPPRGRAAARRAAACR